MDVVIGDLVVVGVILVCAGAYPESLRSICVFTFELKAFLGIWEQGIL